MRGLDLLLGTAAEIPAHHRLVAEKDGLRRSGHLQQALGAAAAEGRKAKECRCTRVQLKLSVMKYTIPFHGLKPRVL